MIIVNILFLLHYCVLIITIDEKVLQDIRINTFLCGNYKSYLSITAHQWHWNQEARGAMAPTL